jgi:hypothetical protein
MAGNTRGVTVPPPPPTVEQSLHCPMCDYDLRGQIEPRCPECGYRFEWEELRDPARRLHPYLFEHHPERNFWSLRRTLFRSLLPRRFWNKLYPTQLSDPRRLILYWIATTLFALVLLVPCAATMVVQIDAYHRYVRTTTPAWLNGMNPQDRARLLSAFGGSVQAFADANYPLFPSPRLFRMALLGYRYPTQPLMLIPLFILAWPAMTLAALMIFQVSMRRNKIRTVHVARCVIYSSGALCVLALALSAWYAYSTLSARWFGQIPAFQFVWCALTGMLLIMTYRLWISYRSYLRFRHALFVVLASQVMVGLLVLKLGLDWHMLAW